MLNLLDVEPSTDVRVLTDQFVQHCYANELSHTTIPTRRTHLKQFADFCDMHGADILSVNNRFMDWYFIEYAEGFPTYVKKRAKSTTNAARRILKVFIRWVEDYADMQVKARPEAIRYTREPKKLPQAIERSTIIAAYSQSKDVYDALMIETMWRAGLRIAELVSLRERQVRGDEIQVYGKGAVERKVYITDSLTKKLERIMSGDPEAPVFRNNKRNYEPICIKAARLHMQRDFRRVGEEMHPHQLRHSFAVGLLMNGCDLVTIQKLMGHEDITTTQIYLRLMDKQVKSQYKKYMV